MFIFANYVLYNIQTIYGITLTQVQSMLKEGGLFLIGSPQGLTCCN